MQEQIIEVDLTTLSKPDLIAYIKVLVFRISELEKLLPAQEVFQELKLTSIQRYEGQQI